MDDNTMKELWEGICKGIAMNPCYYKFYQLLSTYYNYKGNLYQANICLHQALLYADSNETRAEINAALENMEAQGITVPKTAIVILSWNLLDNTRQCINSIRQTTLSDDVQIIVVDNASEDGSVEWLKEQDDIILKCNDENEGFPRGCNQGIELADADADIFLLNNDTVLPPNALFWLKMGLYENERIGTTGAMSNYVSNYQMVQEDFVNPQEVLDYAASHNVPMQSPYEPKIYLVGFALLLKRTVLDEVGLLDERFSPGNSEDVDLGIRMRIAGYENILCKNSIILHFGSQSFAKLGSDFAALMLKNIDKLNDKYGTNMRYYLFPRDELIAYFDAPEDAPIRVLELGCGTGASLAWIRGKYPNAEVYGIEIVEDVARIAASVGNVTCANVETLDFPYEKDFFDYCIMGDVLEHLHDPKAALKKLHKHMKPDGRIMISMPNMKHWSVMLPLLIQDRFTYEDAGILDRTHLKMYTGTEIKKLAIESGFEVLDVSETHEGECPEEFKNIIDTLESFDRSGSHGAYDVYQYIIHAKKTTAKTNLDQSKICFITAVNDDEIYDKCIAHINDLTIPDGMSVETLAVRDGDSMTSAYNAAMNESDAKYKIYLHQDVMITDRDFLAKMKSSFDHDPDIGIAGVVGAKNIPKDGIWWNGSMRGVFTDSHTPDEELHEYKYICNAEVPIEVDALDGIILCTQYDISWREDIFDKWHFYDVSQCREFIRKGYKAVVLPANHSLVEHHCGVASMKNYEDERRKFVAEYL
ncbi:MAG: methyltransferase domain-containing protein [Lachnospiraceae bacterium]|nr:methyltransferase domain-containing protein [Lachnospiraceae bacterium]